MRGSRDPPALHTWSVDGNFLCFEYRLKRAGGSCGRSGVCACVRVCGCTLPGTESLFSRLLPTFSREIVG